jgi:hypothetical protein
MAYTDWLDPSGILLGPSFPLPLDSPFTRSIAAQAGLNGPVLDTLVRLGLLKRPLHGVYVATQAPDTLAMRARTVQLVVSPHAVITDRTAAWLHGVTILERGAHLVAPKVSAFNANDSRIRRSGVRGGRRGLLDRDVMDLGGLRVTTPVRTACDLGRMQWRFDALAGLDGYLRIGVDLDEVLYELPRFRGYRGVCQLRYLAPLADARSESPGESALRLHWYDAGLPTPEPQCWVFDSLGRPVYRVDLGLPELRYAAEYDGEEFHTDDADVEHDDARRAWLEGQNWIVEVFDKRIYTTADPVPRLRQRFEDARRSVSIWTPGLPGTFLTAGHVPVVRP